MSQIGPNKEPDQVMRFSVAQRVIRQLDGLSDDADKINVLIKILEWCDPSFVAALDAAFYMKDTSTPNKRLVR